MKTGLGYAVVVSTLLLSPIDNLADDDNQPAPVSEVTVTGEIRGRLLYDDLCDLEEDPALDAADDGPAKPPVIFRTVQSTHPLAGGGTVVKYTDGSQTINYTDGTVDDIAKDGTITTEKPGQKTVVRHPDGKVEEFVPLSPLQIQAIIDKARCFQQVAEAVQQSDATITGTPAPTAQPPIIYMTPGIAPYGSTTPIMPPYGSGAPGGFIDSEPMDPGFESFRNLPLIRPSLEWRFPAEEPREHPKKTTPWEIPPKKK